MTWLVRPVYLAKEMLKPRKLRISQSGGVRRVGKRTRTHAPVLPAPQTVLPILHDYYDALFEKHGPQSWWPGRTRFEIIVGAILAQNTSWSNVERAIVALRRERRLTPLGIERMPQAKLAGLIRSSGYFRQKARKLKAFVKFLRQNYASSLTKMFRIPTDELREQLLRVHGIGPETADSMLLYAGGHPVFVVDAYTRRVLERHGLVHEKATYEEIRRLFENSLPKRVSLFNEYHALIVQTGKHFCKPRAPLCSACPLKPFLPPVTLPTKIAELAP